MQTWQPGYLDCGTVDAMSNLCSLRKGLAAILDLARAMRGDVGNLEPRDIYPDYPTPIVRNGPDGDRELVLSGAALVQTGVVRCGNQPRRQSDPLRTVRCA